MTFIYIISTKGGWKCCYLIYNAITKPLNNNIIFQYGMSTRELLFSASFSEALEVFNQVFFCG